MAKYIIVNKEFKKKGNYGYDLPTAAIGVTLQQTGPFPAIANRIFDTFAHCVDFLGAANVVPGLILRVIDDPNTMVSTENANTSITLATYNSLPEEDKLKYIKANGAYLVEFDHRGDVDDPNDLDTLKLTKIGSDGVGGGGGNYKEGNNISIDNLYAISAKGYKWDDTKQSFAEGEKDLNVASGNNSHAEGNGTIASGKGSHVEGGSNLSYDVYLEYQANSRTIVMWQVDGKVYKGSKIYNYDKSEVRTVTAISYSNGTPTVTLDGVFEHYNPSTDPNQNNPYNEYPFHVELNTNAIVTEAYGEYSHAEGNGKKALGKSSHAEGISNMVLVTGQNDNPIQIVNDNVEYYPELSDPTNPDGAVPKPYLCSIDVKANITVGDVITDGVEYKNIKNISVEYTGSSFVEKYYYDSPFTNNPTLVYKISSAVGDYSHAEGSGSTGSEYAHAEGASNAAGSYSHAEGETNVAIGKGAHAEGIETIAAGKASHSEGYKTISKEQYAHAEGNGTRAIGESSHTEGDVSYDNAPTLSYKLQVDGLTHNVFYFYSTDGHEINVGDIFSSTIAYNTNANYREYSDNTEFFTVTAVAEFPLDLEGNNKSYVVTFAPSTGSITKLFYVPGGAFGKSSHTEGTSTIAKNQGEHAEGKFNVSHDNTIHSVGIGTSNADRKNALEILNNGDIYINGVGDYDGKDIDENIKSVKEVIDSKQDVLEPGHNISIDEENIITAKGYYWDEEKHAFRTDADDEVGSGTNVATGINSFSCGDKSTASGNYGSFAAGSETVASGVASHAEGNLNVAEAKFSHAEGLRTKTSGNGASHAEGVVTIASGYGSHAEGWGSYGHNEYVQALGDGSHAEGVANTALNKAEHAEGCKNVSHKNSDTFGNSGNTLSSIGVGNDVYGLPHKNAREIMQNGDCYLIGVGNYDGIHIKGEVPGSNVYTVQDVVKQTTEWTILDGDEDDEDDEPIIEQEQIVYDMGLPETLFRLHEHAPIVYPEYEQSEDPLSYFDREIIEPVNLTEIRQSDVDMYSTVDTLHDSQNQTYDELLSCIIGNTVTTIHDEAFNVNYIYKTLQSLTIPISVRNIGSRIVKIGYVGGLNSINYNGTKAQWKSISKSDDMVEFYNDVEIQYTIICADGILVVKTYNELYAEGQYAFNNNDSHCPYDETLEHREYVAWQDGYTNAR